MAFVTLMIAGVGISNLVFLLDSVAALYPHFRGSTLHRAMLFVSQSGPVIALVFFSISVFWWSVLWLHVASPWSRRGLLLVLVSTYLWVNMAFNYFATMLSSPGYPPPRSVVLEDGVATVVFCVKCDRLRAPRVHHCSACKSCVLFMGHHCIITNNCIGLHNYTYYILFLSYTVVGLLFASWLTLDPFLVCFMRSYRDQHAPLLTDAACDGLGELSCLFLLVLFGLLCASTFLAFQLMLLLADMSPIEFYALLSEVTSWNELTVRLKQSMTRGLKGRVRLREMLLSRRRHWWGFLVPILNHSAPNNDAIVHSRLSWKCNTHNGMNDSCLY